MVSTKIETKYYSYISNLKHHFSSVHEGKKPYKCVNCGFRSTSNKDHNRHIVAIHGGKKNFKKNSIDQTCSMKKE